MNIEVIRPASRLNSSSSIKITGVCFEADKLYVGFSNGDFSIYDVDIAVELDPSRKAQLIRLLKSLNDIRTYFSDTKSSNFHHDLSFPNINGDGSSINQIHIVSVNNSTNKIIFVIASPDTIRVFEKVGPHLNLVQVIDEARFFHAFYCYEVNEKKYLAIGVKKKFLILQMIYKSRNIFHFQKINEMVFKERVRAISSINLQLGIQLIVGLSNDFLLVDVNDNYSVSPLVSEEEELIYNFNHSSFSYFGLSSSGPSIWMIKITEEQFLLVKDTQSILLTTNESRISIKESNVKLTASPIFAALIYPCYLLAVYNKKVEIIDIDSGDLIQKIQHQINSGHIPTYVNDSFIFLGASNDLLQFNVLNYQQQIDQFLRFGDNDRRNNKKDPHLDLSLIGLQKAINFVNKIDEEDEYFGGSRVGKEKKKQLFLRDLHKQKAFILFERYSKYHEALVEICSEWLISYKDVLELFPDFLSVGYYTSLDSVSEEIKTNHKSVIKKITLDEIQQNKFNPVITADSGTENEGDQTSKYSKQPPGPGVAGTLASRMPSTIFGQSKSQNIRKFAKSVNNLIIYLTDQRRIHLNFLNEENFQWKGIDIIPSDLYDFITPELANSALEQIAVEIDTSLFLCYFHCKPMLLGPLLRLPNNKCDSKIVNQCLLSNVHKHNNEPNFIKELLDFYFGRNLHQEALEMLYKLGHEQVNHEDEFDDFLHSSSLTIQYLQKLDDSNLQLIFKYSEWLLTEESQAENFIEHGKLIFMNDTYECESYDNFEVLEFLLVTIGNEELAVKYLEWIIFESDFNDNPNKVKSMPKFHTKLCLLYLNQLKAMDIEDSGFENFLTYQKLYDFLKTTELYEPWTVLKHIPTNEAKLLRFTIFIYKRLGEHDKAIDVLYNQLDDLESAMQYCSDIYGMPNSKEYGTKLLHKLLEDLLMHYGENIDAIEKLLRSQGSKMSILRVLTSLPNSFPINKLNEFLRDQLRLTRETLIDSRFSSQLYKVGSIKLQHELLTKQSESYSIDSSRKPCSICHKKLGYSVLSVNDKNQVVHYACHQKI